MKTPKHARNPHTHHSPTNRDRSPAWLVQLTAFVPLVTAFVQLLNALSAVR